MPQQPPFVFLSYPHADIEFATRLKTDLGEQGITVWIDQEGIEVGTREWEETIRDAIRDARETRYETAFHDLVEVLRKVLSEVPSPPSTSIDLEFEPRNPYKGLRAFGTKDARDFFGREALTSELVETLQEALTPTRPQERASGLLAVVGPSGSGKSSVVMAGMSSSLMTSSRPGCCTKQSMPSLEHAS